MKPCDPLPEVCPLMTGRYLRRPCPTGVARHDSSRDGTGYCGICTDGLADEAGPDFTGSFLHHCCIRSLVPQVLLSVPSLTPDPAWATLLLPTFVSSVATLHLLRSLWTSCFPPAPALSVCGWGRSYCESSVHIYHDFLSNNHVFYHLHFLYFNKNVNEKYPSDCLGSETLKFGIRQEVWCS